MLKQKIQEDTIFALKSNEKLKMETLRMLLAAVLTKEKDKRYRTKSEADIELSDEEIIETIVSEMKKRKDAIILYNQGNRPELAEKEEREIDILKKYLPQQLSAEEIKKLVEEAIAKTGAKEAKDMGKVMAELSPKTKGKADGAEVSKIVKELLEK